MLIRALLLICLLAITHSALAAGGAIREMAGILIGLEHYPSDAEKVTLKNIAASTDSTEQERVLAAAISNMNHNVANADRGKVRQIADDAGASGAVRDLAKIMLNISHKPSASDRSKLQDLMK
ncbi:MAG: hypothetical protein HY940_05545 [Gammaproteobacteria bacterium]|nr:hypothetical protein [Gammaproteobacteria bacterium]